MTAGVTIGENKLYPFLHFPTRELVTLNSKFMLNS